MAIDGKKARRAKKPLRTTAVHGTDGQTHIVGIGNLRVIICPDGDGWFAQGLEIDYVASGNSIEDVKENFQSGLKGTISLHLQMTGNIEKLLNPAPREIWRELHRVGTHHRYSQVSLHDDMFKHLRFEGIDYFEPTPEVAA